MEKKVIDTGIQAMLQEDEIGTVKMLHSILKKIYTQYGDITDAEIRKYNNNENTEYKFNVTISTIRNYLKPYHYVVQKNENVIVREMSLDEYEELVGQTTTKTTTSTDTKENFIDNLTTKQKISISYADKSEKYDDVKMLSLRCSKNVLERFNAMAQEYKCFEKSYLLSFTLEAGLDAIDYKPKR